jgi:radical SAM superfamily enzyme YgiQ (UPF0313 family)
VALQANSPAWLDREGGGTRVKILLIEPAKGRVSLGGEDASVYEPLALEYIAAGVTKHHDVRLLDLRLEKGLLEVLNEFQPEIVGVTSYTVHVDTVVRLFERVKDWHPEVLTVVGGHHATVAPTDFLSWDIDLVVRGEGVDAFREIVTRFEKGESLTGIPGVAVRRDGELVGSSYEHIVDLDALPLPDRRVTAAYRNRYFSEWMKPLASMRTSKGCPYRCSFCAQWKIAGGHYLRRDPEKVVAELADIEEQFVFFADDESLIDVARMRKLARLIKVSGVKKRYFLYGRSDTIAANADLLEAWRNVGLERVFVGLESFRDQDLDYVGKRSTLEDNEKAVDVLQRLGIEIYASFIVRPEFTRQDFSGLRDYCRQLGLSFASFAVLTPLPGTDLWDQVEDRLITREYELFDLVHTVLPTRLSLKDFYEEYHQLFSRAIPFSRQVSFLKRFPVEEIPRSMMRYQRILRRLKRAHEDYGDSQA